MRIRVRSGSPPSGFTSTAAWRRERARKKKTNLRVIFNRLASFRLVHIRPSLILHTIWESWESRKELWWAEKKYQSQRSISWELYTDQKETRICRLGMCNCLYGCTSSNMKFLRGTLWACVPTRRRPCIIETTREECPHLTAFANYMCILMLVATIYICVRTWNEDCMYIFFSS